MRGRVVVGMSLMAAALGLPAMANVPENATRGEKLAWHIEAYVQCNAELALDELRTEVEAFDATRSELILALSILEFDESACAELKDASGALLALAASRPGEFDATFGFAGVRKVEGRGNDMHVSRVEATDQLDPKDLTPPPQASAQKTRSSY